MKSICFVTTGDIKDIATAKRALGLANPHGRYGGEQAPRGVGMQG